MTEMTVVYETTGAVAVSVDGGYVVIEQASITGEAPQSVAIPRPLFREVLSCIFARLEQYELREIEDLAGTHAKPMTRIG